VQLRSAGTHAEPPVVSVKQAKPWGHSWPPPQKRAQTLVPEGSATQVPPGHSAEVAHVWQKGKSLFALRQRLVEPSQTSHEAHTLVA
jgi:hypothetical protein